MGSWMINQYWWPPINSPPSRWAGENRSHVLTYREQRSGLPILYTVIGGCTSLIVWRWRLGKAFVIWWLEGFFSWYGIGLRSTSPHSLFTQGRKAAAVLPQCVDTLCVAAILSARIRQRRRTVSFESRFGCESDSHNEHNPPLMSKVELKVLNQRLQRDLDTIQNKGAGFVLGMIL